MKRKRLIGCLLALLLFAAGMAYWNLTAGPPFLGDDLEAAPASTAANPDNESAEEKKRRRLLGVWYDKRQADRLLTMTLNQDGTGTLLVELSGPATFLMGSRLRFDMRWSLAGEEFSTRMVGGEPAGKVNLILNTKDISGHDTILELTDQRLLLLDKDGKTRYEWRRRAGDPGK